jgi:hypothetical protein
VVLEAQNSFDINDQTVAIGATNVEIPILVDNSENRHGLSFSIKYDQTKLQFVNFSLVGTASANADWDGGTSHAGSGELIWGIVLGFDETGNGSFDETKILPPGNDLMAGKLIFNVVATTAGQTTISFMDDLPSFSPRLTKNKMTTAGVAIGPTLGSATITISAITGIGPFIRGDCNGDGDSGGVNDALVMLTRNFIGLPQEVPCAAACDSNGDADTGGVNDALVLLTHNFINPVITIGPFPLCGTSDRAEDRAIGCAARVPGCP